VVPQGEQGADGPGASWRGVVAAGPAGLVDELLSAELTQVVSGLTGRPRGRPGLSRGQFGPPRVRAALLQRERLGQRRVAERLLVHPHPVRAGPLRAAPDAAVAQQHRVQPLPHPLAVIQQVPAGAHQVSHASSSADGTRTGVQLITVGLGL
jgi:hypothetical protein